MDDVENLSPEPARSVQFGLRKLFYFSAVVSVWFAAGTGFGPLGLIWLPATAAFIAWLAGLIPMPDLIIALLISYALCLMVLSEVVPIRALKSGPTSGSIG